MKGEAMRGKLTLLTIYFLLATVNFANEIDIKIINSVTEINRYIKQLLEPSLIELGYNPNITFTASQLGSERGFAAISENEADIFWSGNRNMETDQIFFLDIPITNNLLGRRIIFIPKGHARNYENIYNIDDLRNSGKVGGFGRRWRDARIWEENNLPFHEKENGNWQALYLMIAKQTRGIDYFSRGVIEIIPEYENIVKKNNIDLEIEPNLIFQYNLDFLIYLNRENTEKNKIIEKALIHARDTGLMDKAVEEFWRKDFEQLNISNRRIIKIPN